MTFNISATKGVISFLDTSELSFLVGTGTKDQSVVFKSTLVAANRAFRAINYDTVQYQNGEDKILISVNDNGASGFAGDDVLITYADIDILIDGVNTPPIITIPAGIINAVVDVEQLIEGVSVFDVDIDSFSRADSHGKQYTGFMTVNLVVTHGRITLTELTGLTFEEGDGIHDDKIQFTGMTNDINNALERIVYICESELSYTGPSDSIQITIYDNGNSGKSPNADGSNNLSDTAVILINVQINQFEAMKPKT